MRKYSVQVDKSDTQHARRDTHTSHGIRKYKININNKISWKSNLIFHRASVMSANCEGDAFGEGALSSAFVCLSILRCKLKTLADLCREFEIAFGSWMGDKRSKL